jgi:undecaprenyl-diphosphatase
VHERTRRFFVVLAYVRENRAIHLLALLLVVFVVLTLAVLHVPALSAFDRDASRAFQRSQADPLVAFARFWTHAGDMGTLLLIGIPAALFLLWRSRPCAAWLCALSLLGHPLNLLLKMPVGRDRPDASVVAILLPAHGSSFPSGHAMATVMFYGFLALLAWVHLRRRRARVPLTLIAASLPVLVGLSRIYVGGHWLSDVIGGWTAGLFFLFLIAEVYKSVGARELSPHGEKGAAAAPAATPTDNATPAT